MNRFHTNRSDDVGPVVFNRLPTWWIIASGGLSERFPVHRSGFFDEFRLFHVVLVHFKRFPPLRQQTGSNFPERFLVCQMVRADEPASDIKQAPKNHFRHTGNRSGKPLPVCCGHGWFCLESTAVASISRTTASKHVQTVWIHYRDTVSMHMCPLPIVGPSKKLSSVGEVNHFRCWSNVVRWISSTSTFVVCWNLCSLWGVTLLPCISEGEMLHLPPKSSLQATTWPPAKNVMAR